MDRLETIRDRAKRGVGIYSVEWEDPDWSDLEWLLAEVERLRRVERAAREYVEADDALLLAQLRNQDARPANVYRHDAWGRLHNALAEPSRAAPAD